MPMAIAHPAPSDPSHSRAQSCSIQPVSLLRFPQPFLSTFFDHRTLHPMSQVPNQFWNFPKSSGKLRKVPAKFRKVPELSSNSAPPKGGVAPAGLSESPRIHLAPPPALWPLYDGACPDLSRSGLQSNATNFHSDVGLWVTLRNFCRYSYSPLKGSFYLRFFYLRFFFI